MKTTLAFGFLFCLFAVAGWGQAVDTAAVRREVDSLIAVVRNLEKAGQFQQALEIVQEAKRLTITYFGKTHPLYAACLNREGSIYMVGMGNYKESIGLHLEAIEIQEKTLGKDNMDYTRYTNNLGNLYYSNGQLENAESYYRETALIRGRILGKNHPDYARALGNLGSVLRRLGRHEEAETIHIKAYGILKNTGNNKSDNYYYAVRNLAEIYRSMGNYAKSEAYYFEAQELALNLFGESHWQYGNLLANIARLYAAIYQLDKSEAFIKQGLKIISETLGENHPEYAYSLNVLANLYTNQGKYEQSVQVYKKSLSIMEAKMSGGHAETALATRQLAVCLEALGRYPEADSLYLKAIGIQAQELGERHQDYAWSLLRFANSCKSQKRYKEAEDIYIKALEAFNKSVGRGHADFVYCLNEIALFYQLIGRPEKAQDFFAESSKLNQQLILHSTSYLSYNELSNFIEACPCQRNINGLFSFANMRVMNSPSLSKILWDNILYFKGLLLANAREIERIIVDAPDSTRAVHAEWKHVSRQLATEYNRGTYEQQLLTELENKASALEKLLARSLNGFANARRQITLTEVINSLVKSEVAIEFTHFQFYDQNNIPTDSTFYSALVLLPTDTIPRYFPLFEQRQLARLLAKTESRAEASNTLYAARSGEVLDQAPAHGAELYKLIWKPLDSLLQANNIKTVYFSPSGLLHRVAFAALPVPPFKGARGVLSDRYALRQLGSTRSLVVKTPEPVAKDYTAAVFGGVRYDRTATLPADSTLAEITDNRLWNLIDKPAERGSDDGGFDYLPGTQQEARRLEQLLAQNRVRVQTHTGDRATEEALKTLGRDTVKSPDILHIATHGFFFPDPEKRKEQRFGDENAFKWNENPLFRSGLALAGANTAWSGQPTPGHIEDGIATAYEISHLNLSNTKLAVLSACQTGLGDIKGSEGVYGLQRAFKMAGVDYLLVSLWQVPDKETAEFMDIFYKTWLGGKTIHEAFAKAQKKMRKKYKEVYKWGAWVLVE